MAQNILLVRLSAMGDIVFASPLVPAFRRRYPDARISWLVAQPFADLLQTDPLLDEVLVLPTRRWSELLQAGRYVELLREVRKFVRDLKARNFDLVLDLQGLIKSGFWTWLSGARRRIGLGSREGSQWLMHEVVDRHGGDNARIASEYLYLANQLGLPAAKFPLRVSYSQDARDLARKLIADRTTGDGYGVICPFTTRPQKHWTKVRWIELAGELRARYGHDVVMLGGPADAAPARIITASGVVINLVGETGIQTAAAIISDARYLVGVDTGLTHMGLAFERPTVCLFGSTRPYTDTATAAGRVLFHEMPCAPCRRHPTCDGAYTCMTGIQPAEVIGLLDGLLRPEASVRS